jgi:amino-acid N-acetyltransferase
VDLPAIEALLREAGLPLEGLAEQLGAALVAQRDGRLVGCVALELYGPDALLRSVAARASERGRGLGRSLVEASLSLAAARGVARVWLLTTTAETYFLRFGFRSAAREDAPPALLRSAEFRGACPATAVLMRRSLSPGDRGAASA